VIVALEGDTSDTDGEITRARVVPAATRA